MEDTRRRLHVTVFDCEHTWPGWIKQLPGILQVSSHQYGTMARTLSGAALL